ncbi:MAG: 50S ribosomal protein L5 [Candidatus Moraniibacteriota bacterium]
MASITQKIYASKALPELKKFLGTENVHAIPRFNRVVVNVGVGKFMKEQNRIDEIKQSLEMITGQKVVPTKARKAIAGFKIREGLEVGMRVTLRGERMWHFLDRFINVGLPRVRDFQGIPRRAIDSYGNANIGIKEQTVFPEIIPEKVQTMFSFQVTIVTTAADKKTGEKLFELIGLPLQAVGTEERKEKE